MTFVVRILRVKKTVKFIDWLRSPSVGATC